MRLHYFFLLSGLVATVHLQGQSGYLPLHRDLLPWLMPANDSAWRVHTSIRPYFRKDWNVDYGSDSPFKKQREGKKWDVEPFPVLQAGTGTSFLFSLGAGLSVQADPSRKWSFNLSYLYVWRKIPMAEQALADSGFISHYGPWLSRQSSGSYLLQDLTGYISWTPLPSLNLTLGRGRNFWGEGYRSLFLSDFSASYPYLKTTFTAWRITYVSLLAKLQDDWFSSLSGNQPSKFTALHYLDWNVTHTFRLSLFEGVVWRGTDSTGYRSLDFQYVNPVLFYRPVEFSFGSPDNMVLGVGASFHNNKGLKIYTQLMLDEFVFSKMLHDPGWWANKYGIQCGVKGHNAFRVPGLDLLSELNLVRPYTYSHDPWTNNYGNNLQPLAHPAGANFIEWLGNLQYHRQKYLFSAYLSYTLAGLDSAGYNMGQNIFESYSTRISDEGIHLLQGKRSNSLTGDVHVSRLLLPGFNLFIEAGMMGSFSGNGSPHPAEGYFYISLKSLLNNDESFR